MHARALIRGLALLTIGCALPTDAADSVQQRLIGGQPSLADDDATVMVRVGDLSSARCDQAGSNCAVCSGRLLTPRLVLTAHHCVLANRLTTLSCASDGTATGESVNADLTLVKPDGVAVFVGNDAASLRQVAVSQIVTGFVPSVCNQDIAFLVLAEPALDVRTPLRRTPVKLGDTFSIAGWGFTLGAGEPLPDQRQARSDLRVIEVGPGPETPAGMFATGGASLCQGDSGAVAVIDGAAVGVYSRVSGACSSPQSRNFLQGIATIKALTEEAFAAIDEVPWYIEDDPPADAGAEPQDAGTDASSPVNPPADGPTVAPADEGCAAAPGQPGPFGGCVTLLVCAALRRRRRRALTAPHTC